MKGGDLFWIWKPYECVESAMRWVTSRKLVQRLFSILLFRLYGSIDHVYGPDFFNSGSGFTSAQAFLNVVETLLNLSYVYLVHGAGCQEAIAVAPLVGWTAAVMTLSKTALYWLQEYFCGYCAVGHNDSRTLFWLWIVPNVSRNLVFFTITFLPRFSLRMIY